MVFLALTKALFWESDHHFVHFTMDFQSTAILIGKPPLIDGVTSHISCSHVTPLKTRSFLHPSHCKTRNPKQVGRLITIVPPVGFPKKTHQNPMIPRRSAAFRTSWTSSRSLWSVASGASRPWAWATHWGPGRWGGSIRLSSSCLGWADSLWKPALWAEQVVS